MQNSPTWRTETFGTGRGRASVYHFEENKCLHVRRYMWRGSPPEHWDVQGTPGGVRVNHVRTSHGGTNLCFGLGPPWNGGAARPKINN